MKTRTWLIIMVPVLFVVTFVGTIIFTLISALIWAWPVMYLWNYIMPSFFSLPTVSYWTSVAVFILATLLLKGHTDSGMSALVNYFIKEKAKQEEVLRKAQETLRSERRERNDFQF